MSLPKVTIFSDWWANPNPGPWWYGVILEYRWIKKELSRGYKKTTNNRMELRGIITWLEALKEKSEVTIITDSRYTINGIEKWWARSWQKNGWIKSDKKPAQNADLWEQLLWELDKHEVEFFWIKGHNGHPENERCDELATLAMNKKSLREDVGYNEEKPSSTEKPLSILSWEERWDSSFEKVGNQCKKCWAELVKKYPKHSKKTLDKKYFYAYYHHCQGCKTNYMLEEAKRDIRELKL